MDTTDGKCQEENIKSSEQARYQLLTVEIQQLVQKIQKWSPSSTESTNDEATVTHTPSFQDKRPVDGNGNPMCKGFFFNKHCRFKNKCIFSHEFPKQLAAEYDALHSMVVEQNKLNQFPPPEPILPPLVAPSWLEDLRRERIDTYDVVRYPFAEAMAEILEAQSVDELSSLHRRTLTKVPPLNPRLIHAFRFAGIKLPTSWKKAEQRQRQMIHRMIASPPYVKFMTIYQKFITEVIVPVLGGSLRFQTPPTMRIHMPCRKPTILPHTDMDYDCHQCTEINFWVPLTKVWGTNTLWRESAPGLKDFHPVELDYGQFLKFNGNQCTHFTKPNDSDATRVSFDFRCIPLSEYTKAFDCKIGDYNSEVAIKDEERII
eukprot:m.258184 g.258184  ORF g.258184 m.258184 type:complete len:373 (-) comp36249_c0_seq1:77-1195(-)